MLFSERYGITPVKQIIQVDSVDADLRNQLWNSLAVYYWDKADCRRLVHHDRYHTTTSPLLPLLRTIWHSYFKKPLDTLNNDWHITYEEIRKYFFSCKWYDVYNFIEFIANSSENEEFCSLCNMILEKELSAYRFVNGNITKLTANEEIEAIEQAIKSTDKFNTATIHLKTALKLLSDRKAPDYRNSIKESISAVEAACIVISEDPNATLGKALKIIESNSKIDLHFAIKSAFDKLYGYTSDANGIRHALLEEPNLKFEDAKFMLVSCSAFINYLFDKSKN